MPVNKNLRYWLAIQGQKGLKFVEPFSKYFPIPKGAFRILIFHGVARAQYAAFEKLLCYLLENHGVINASEAEETLEGRTALNESKQIPYLLTFDDGFASNAGLSHAILSRYGIKAIFFVCPGLMDMAPDKQKQAIKDCIFAGKHSPSIDEETSLMSWEELHLLQDQGHAIGSHTLNHRRLSQLSQDQQHEEIALSADAIKKQLGISTRWFAYPFGDIASIDSSSLKLISVEYQFCLSGVRGINSCSTHRLGLFREHVDLTAPFEYQILTLKGCLDPVYFKDRRHLAAMIKEAGLGDFYGRAQTEATRNK